MRNGIALLFLTGFAVCAGELSLPFSGESLELNMPDTRNQDVFLRTDGMTEVIYDRSRAKICELNFPGGIAILPLRNRVEVFAEIKLPEKNSAERIFLRVMDRDGEIFNCPMPLQKGTGGQRYSWSVDLEKKFPSSWGKRKNGKIDPPFFIHSFAVGFRRGSGCESILLNRFGWKFSPEAKMVRTDAPEPRSIRIRTVGGTCGLGVFPPESREKFEVILENRTAEPLKKEVGLRILDENGVLERKKLSCKFSSGSIVRIPLDVPEKFGRYLAEVSVDGHRGELRFARMDPAGNRAAKPGVFRLGVNAHITRKKPREYREKEIAAAALIGAQSIRSGASMQLLWPEPGLFRFKRADFAAKMLKKYNLRWDMLCAGSPRWTTRTGWKPVVMPAAKGHSCPDYGLWSDYVFLLMTRYGHLIDRLEIWNEPELPGFANFTPGEYAELLKYSWRTAKGVNPRTQVTTAGFTCLPGAHPKMTDPDFMVKSLNAARGCYDILAFHGHGTYSSYVRTIDGLHKLRQKLGIDRIPWFANETAVSAIGIGERRQAETLFQKVIFTQARGADGYLWYDMTNDGFNPLDNEHNFGLLTHDLRPKYAFCAFNTLGKHFYRAEYVRDLSNGGGLVEGYEFRRGSDVLLPFWKIGNSVESVFCVFSSNPVSEFDLWGNRRELGSGKILVSAGRSPKFLHSTGPIEMRGIVAAFREPPLTDASGNGTVVLDCLNPFSEPLKISVTPDRKPAREIPLNPDGKTELSFPFEKNSTLRFGISIGSNRAVLTATPEKLKTLPVYSPGRKEDFRLNRAFQQYPTAPNDPMYQNCFWKGPADLSAKIMAGRAGSSLKLRVEVLDDVHFVEKDPSKLFLGDSIQFALQLPDRKQFWEFGVSGSGKFCWQSDGVLPAENALAALNFRVSRDETAKTTVYEIDLPFSAIGLNPSKPFRFNLLVNDSDGILREGFLALAPGLGSLKSPEKFVPVKLK